LRPLLSIEPGMIVQARVSSGTFRRGDRRRRPLEVEVRGHDPDVTQDLAEQVREAMITTEGVASALISRRPGTPEMLVRVDRAKATSMGLKVSEISQTLETAVGGSRASMFREDGDEFDILVRLREQDRLAWSRSATCRSPWLTAARRFPPKRRPMNRQEGTDPDPTASTSSASWSSAAPSAIATWARSSAICRRRSATSRSRAATSSWSAASTKSSRKPSRP
jgi:hypothetical protein